MSISHHSAEEQAAMQRLVEEVMGRARVNHPEGRISQDDEGETAYMIAADKENGCVIIQFTKPMRWIGLPLKEATALRDALTAKIELLK
jgi:hypothetical protein